MCRIRDKLRQRIEQGRLYSFVSYLVHNNHRAGRGEIRVKSCKTAILLYYVCTMCVLCVYCTHYTEGPGLPFSKIMILRYVV